MLINSQISNAKIKSSRPPDKKNKQFFQNFFFGKTNDVKKIQLASEF